MRLVRIRCFPCLNEKALRLQGFDLKQTIYLYIDRLNISSCCFALRSSWN